jgi:hypothetical protein
MSHPTPSPRRRSMFWTALLAVCVVIVSPIIGAWGPVPADRE